MANNSAVAIDVTLQNAVSTNGNGTVVPTGGLPGVGLQIVGTFSATVNFEATIDGSNWVAIPAINLATLALSTTATAAGLFYVPLAGVDQLRARVSGYASGSLTVTGKGIVASGTHHVAALQAAASVLGTVNVGTIAAGETHVGQVGTEGTIVTVTPTLDTSAYAAGDVLFDTTAIANAVRVSGGRAELVSIQVLDEDDQTAAVLDLYFLRSNVSLGTFNVAPAITDANAREILGYYSFASGDFKDLGGSKVATARNVGLILAPTTGTTLYVAGVTAGTPTQTASGIKLQFGFRWH